MTKTKSILLGCALMGAAQLSMAEIAGKYMSEGEDACTITITPLDVPTPQFGDAFWRVESRGPASCMWDAAGNSHSTELVAGSISLPPLSPRGLVHLKWVFGPGSNQVDVKFINADGNVLATQKYMRQ
ncbi:MAG: hypothetical protein R3332_04525 [Pseudohongiellaceae bacterium]|nr:hypothetical protein [Pseudohongiellaceae bacterium]